MNNLVSKSFPSSIDAVDDAVVFATEFAAKAGFGDELLYAIDMAVRECAINAVRHGNKFNETKQFEVSLEVVADAIFISVRDFGSGFEEEDVPDPTNPENLMKASGRGLLFMRTFMDDVTIENADGGGTRVIMKKGR